MQSTKVSLYICASLSKLTELSNVHDIVLVLQNRSLVVIHVEVIRCAEDGHHTRETSRPRLPVHSVTGILGFVGTNDGEQVVLFEEGAGGGIREEVRASTNVVVYEEIIRLLLSKLFEWIGPENVAHQAMRRWLSETVNLDRSAKVSQAPVSTSTYAFQVVQSVKLGAQSTMYAQKLFVHNRGQR